MFSGIVETAATVVALRKEGGNLHITMKCDFAPELRIDQSVAHNGVCLTVVDLPGDGEQNRHLRGGDASVPVRAGG